jgi:hypothetical protein
MSQDNKSLFRETIESVEGVTRTSFEWELGGMMDNRAKTLVIEVSFDLDPNSDKFSRAGIDAIEHALATVRRENETNFSKVKLVNANGVLQSAESDRRPPKKAADTQSAPMGA